MPFDDVYPVTTRLEPVSIAEVDRLGAEFGLGLPDGYREFLARFGRGVVCDYLQVRDPVEARVWRQECAEQILCADLFEINEWAAQGVTFAQYQQAVSVLDTDQSSYYLSVPGHGTTLFEVESGGIVTHSDGLPAVIRSVITMFGLEFPYFEPAHEGRRYASYLIRQGVEFDAFLTAVASQWGPNVRRLGSKEDGYAVTLFARPVQAKFVCYRESGDNQSPPFSFQVNAFYDAEEAAEVHEFLRAFARDADARTA